MLGKLIPKAAYKPQTSVFLLIDISERMSGARIETVNHVMKDLIPELNEFAENYVDCTLRLNILAFNNTITWHTYDFTERKIQEWQDIEAGGIQSLGMAFKALNEKLSRKNRGFLKSGLNNIPTIILLTDGYTTDEANSGLSLLKENAWYQHSFRIAYELGQEVNSQILTEFTIDNHNINPDDYGKYIIDRLTDYLLNSGICTRVYSKFENKTIITEDDEDYYAEYGIANPAKSPWDDNLDAQAFVPPVPSGLSESKSIRVGESLTWEFSSHGSVGIFTEIECDNNAFKLEESFKYDNPENLKVGGDRGIVTYKILALKVGIHYIRFVTYFRGTIQSITDVIVSVI